MLRANTVKRQRRLFIVDYLLTPDRRIDHAAILCDGEKILGVGGLSAFSQESDMEIYTFDRAYATPGFIDSHIHGAGGFDCSCCAESVRPFEDMCKLLCQCGVTTFVPTVVADEPGKMLSNLENLAALIAKPSPGAEPIGINLEGPFINPLKCGAQEVKCLREVDLGFARELLQAGQGKIKLMTFAPELENSLALVEFLCAEGVIPSMGHSVADEPQTLRAIDAGARRCTHLFNGMPVLHQREMSITSICLTDRRVAVEMIIDGRHLHPRIVDLTCRCKNHSNIIGISDGTQAAGMPNGSYRIGPSSIEVKDGFSRNRNGLLAGTTTMLDTGWHCLMSYGHLEETQAAAAVTRNAAIPLGAPDRGELLPRLYADIAIFECGSNRPLMTIRHGKVIYDSGTNVKRTGADYGI
ncbi:MAG: amidohydrolase family protein [Victivallaceae bacterium]|nr:amidohydrolase family protein [Victivallaceae bacterium]